MNYESYPFDTEFQDLLLACIIKHPQKFLPTAGLLSSAYFSNIQQIATARAVIAYWNKMGHLPSSAILGQIVYKAILRHTDEKEEDSIMAYVNRIREMETPDVDYVASQVVAFARERACNIALRTALECQRDGKEPPPGGYTKLFEDALKVGLNLSEMGYKIQKDGGDILAFMAKYTSQDFGTPTGFGELDRIWPFGWAPGWLISILAPPKRYKCLGKGTGILMFDGSVKAVEDIVVGDLIMGDDSKPRTVNTCGKGVGQLYRVRQSSGKDFICNDAHILCLKHQHHDEIKELSAEVYAAQAPWFKRQWRGYKIGIEFPEREVTLDPYFLGLWLGDGTAAEADICVADKDLEVADYLHGYAARLGMRITKQPGDSCATFCFVKAPKRASVCSVYECKEPHRAGGFCHRHYCQRRYRGFRACPDGQKHWINPISSELISLGVLKNKHIPDVYKKNSREHRLALLAGLIDSDGSFVPGRGMIFSNSNHRLATEVCWLAQSLGFHAYTEEFEATIKSTGYKGKSWRVHIAGSLSQIPTKVARKRGIDSAKNTGRRYAIDVEPVGVGDYYGFTIDGNGRFLLDDFTVTHNTMFCINLAMNIIKNTNAPVFYYPCEISQELAAVRCLCNLTGLTMDFARQNSEGFIEKALDECNAKLNSTLLIKGYASRTATISGDIRSHALAAKSHLGINPKAIIIDFAETVKPSSDPKRTSDHRAQGEIYVEARALGFELGCPVILPDRCNKETVDRPVPSMKSFQGSFEKAGHVDVAMGLCSSDQEYLENKIRYFIFLNRHGPAYQHFQGKIDPATTIMSFLGQIDWKPEEDEEEKPGARFRKRKRAPVDELHKLGEDD